MCHYDSPEAYNSENALLKAETMCARAEYSTREILQRVMGWGVSRTDAESVVERLVNEGFIDNRRFAIAYARQQAESAGWGQRKIALAMMRKGIDREDVAEALSCLDHGVWRRMATNLAKAKWLSLGRSSDYEARVKVFRYLAGRGYDSTTINEVLRALKERCDGDT